VKKKKTKTARRTVCCGLLFTITFNSKGKSAVFDHAELEEPVFGRLSQRSTTGNGNMDVLDANLAIFGCMLGLLCRNHLATLLSSSSWSKMLDWLLGFRRYVS